MDEPHYNWPKVEKMGFERQQRLIRVAYGQPTDLYFDGVLFHFKSKAEARWARYLEKLVEMGAIISWEYEPYRFIEKQMRLRKIRTYLPDFRVVEDVDGLAVKVWHEVKEGNLQQKNITNFRWMRKDYPEETIVLVCDCSRSPQSQQGKLISRAREHVHRIIYADPLLKKWSIK